MKDLVESFLEQGLIGASNQTAKPDAPEKYGHSRQLRNLLPMTEQPVRSFANSEMDDMYLERSMNDAPGPNLVAEAPAKYGRDTPLPEFFPRTGHIIPSLTNAEIEEMLIAEDLEKIGRS